MISLLRICHLLMASLFALSASFQFNDPDWYFWIPLYSTACIANLVNGESRIRKLGKFALWLGLFLFIKVAVEDLINGTAGFWCLEMRERVVREKFGSGLVVTSMFLVLGNSSASNRHPTRLAKYGSDESMGGEGPMMNTSEDGDVDRLMGAGIWRTDYWPIETEGMLSEAVCAERKAFLRMLQMFLPQA